MRIRTVSHLTDAVLVSELKALAATDRGTTAQLLVHLGEVDTRKLYVPAGYPSLLSYCIHELLMSEDAALKRIQAARAAREFPAIYGMVLDGRLHLTAVVKLAPHLTSGNADELLAAGAHKSKEDLQQVIAERFPRSEVFTWVEGAGATTTEQNHETEVVPEPVVERHRRLIPAAKVTPLSAETVAWQVSVPRSVNDKLRYAKELLGHQVSAGDVAKVLELGLDALIEKLEKRKFGACRKRRSGPQRVSANSRHIPAAVKSEVWVRDGGQCTFVGDGGHRCPARSPLEFDHIEPVARGGRSTFSNLQLRCRAHNHYEAERAFGADFMKGKREAAAERARERKKASEGRSTNDQGSDVIPWLRGLGIRVDDARRAAELCADIPDAPLEERVRRALSYFRKRPGVHVVAAI